MKTLNEPAIFSYFYYKGDWYYNLIDICKETAILNIESGKHFFDYAVQTLRDAKYSSKLIYFKVIFLFLCSLAVFMGTVVFLPFLLVTFVAIVLFVWIIYNMIAIEMNLTENLFLKFHGLFILCKSCNHKIPLPIYKCPGCGAEHQHLMPSTRYGAFYRICSQCGEFIPTSRFFGRNDLPALCRNCHQPLEQEDVVPYTIAIVGGSSVGKSSIQMDITYILLHDILPGLNWNYTLMGEDKDRASSLINDYYLKGIPPRSTPDQQVKALCIDVKAQKWAYPKRLFLFDPPGESFQNTKKLSSHNYYKYLRSIIFVIDPFSIDSVLHEFPELPDSVTASTKSPEDWLDSWFISMNTDHGGVDKKTICAVLINKTDVPGFTETTGLKTGATHEECDAFFDKYSCQNLKGLFEEHFEKYRFFAVSAFGANRPDHSFSPEGISEVINWLLENQD